MQITKYKWQGLEPFLFINSNDGFSKIKLFDSILSMQLGKKTCTGYFKDGVYFSCPHKTIVTNEHQCNECKLNDDFFFCMKCDGSRCINEKMKKGCEAKNFFIYLAAFGPKLKVGISFERRIFERLIEQGADFGAKVCFVKDGKSARIIEQQIKHKLSIIDRLTGDEKHEIMFGDPNIAAANIFNAINKLKKMDFNQYLIKPEIYDLRKYYRLENVFLDPKNLRIKDNTEISGRVVAAKGNLIIFNAENEFYSVNAHSLYGREVLSLSVHN